VLQVLFTAGGPAELPVDVTEDALPAGQSTEGNAFVFQGGQWAFNLLTTNYSAPDSYTVRVFSGDQDEYRLGGGILGSLPTCEATFVVE
jgi:hypothetical protein